MPPCAPLSPVQDEAHISPAARSAVFIRLTAVPTSWNDYTFISHSRWVVVAPPSGNVFKLPLGMYLKRARELLLAKGFLSLHFCLCFSLDRYYCCLFKFTNLFFSSF